MADEIDQLQTVQLIANNQHYLYAQRVTLVGGQKLAAGALLGRVAGTNQYKLSMTTASDGSELPNAVLAHDADGTDGNMSVLIYLMGDFIIEAMRFGSFHTVESVRESLRVKGIFLLNSEVASPAPVYLITEEGDNLVDDNNNSLIG